MRRTNLSQTATAWRILGTNCQLPGSRQQRLALVKKHKGQLLLKEPVLHARICNVQHRRPEHHSRKDTIDQESLRMNGKRWGSADDDLLAVGTSGHTLHAVRAATALARQVTVGGAVLRHRWHCS